MQKLYELPHEHHLVHVLGAIVVFGWTTSKIPPVEQPIVHLVLPGASLDPFIDLAEAAEVFVVERGIRVAHRVLVAVADRCSPADQLLPEHTDAHRGGVDLGGERPLVGQEEEKVPEYARERRRRLEDLDRVGLADAQPRDGTVIRLDLLQLDPVDLAGEAASHEPRTKAIQVPPMEAMWHPSFTFPLMSSRSIRRA